MLSDMDTTPAANNNFPIDAQKSLDERIRQRAHALNTSPKNHIPHGNIPNTPLAASTVSFLLGGIFFSSFFSLLSGSSQYWWLTYQTKVFFTAWSAFHWGEFAVTAGWNLEKCSVDSFLLDNGALYHVANGIGLSEYLLELYFAPNMKSHPFMSALGIILVIAGQWLRSSAMIHASTNFSHTVAFRKAPNHTLVTDGVYAWSRHPSYSGFFYWALGTQLVMLNPISFIVFTIILWRFFYKRTRAEEAALVKFFGNEYVEYRQRVGTKIPFIP